MVLEEMEVVRYTCHACRYEAGVGLLRKSVVKECAQNRNGNLEFELNRRMWRNHELRTDHKLWSEEWTKSVKDGLYINTIKEYNWKVSCIRRYRMDKLLWWIVAKYCWWRHDIRMWLVWSVLERWYNIISVGIDHRYRNVILILDLTLEAKWPSSINLMQESSTKSEQSSALTWKELPVLRPFEGPLLFGGHSYIVVRAFFSWVLHIGTGLFLYYFIFTIHVLNLLHDHLHLGGHFLVIF